MKMNHLKLSPILLTIFLFASIQVISQTRIFNPDKELVYEFSYSAAGRGQVATGEIIIKPTDKPWEKDNSQKKITFEYTFTKRDSSYFKRGEHDLPIQNEKEETTGYIENDRYFWTHPFRTNIFYITEVAPFPSYFKGGLRIKSKTILYIKEGWGKFKGTSKRNYSSVKFKEQIKGYENVSLRQVSMRANHKLGKSYLTMIVADNKEIIEMQYSFFNNDKLVIVLKDIRDK